MRTRAAYTFPTGSTVVEALRRVLDAGSDFRSERYLGFFQQENRRQAAETVHEELKAAYDKARRANVPITRCDGPGWRRASQESRMHSTTYPE